MTDLLTNFDRDKNELSSRIAAAPSIEAVVKLTDAYLNKLHGDTTKGYSLQKSRFLGYMFEIVRYSVRMLNAVDAVVPTAGFRPPDIRQGQPLKGFVMFGKAEQSAVLLALLMALLSVNPVPWMPIMLVFIVLGVEIFLHVSEWRMRSASKRIAGGYMPSDILNQLPAKVNAQLEIKHIHGYLNCIADALSYADKALNERPSEKEGDALEKETQILKLFQELFEAKAFHDGEWALKKIGQIQAILWERGIVVTEFDAENPENSPFFDIEPGADPSINHHVTIRPAFIKQNRVLLRGRVAEPFSTTQHHSPGL